MQRIVQSCKIIGAGFAYDWTGKALYEGDNVHVYTPTELQIKGTRGEYVFLWDAFKLEDYDKILEEVEIRRTYG